MCIRDRYKAAKKMRSALSGIFKYEVSENDPELSDDLKSFLDEHLKNDILSESEAREYLILSGQYQAGEHGIGEASKMLSTGWKHLKKFEAALETSGKVFDSMDKISKADELVEYWVTNYAAQELKLDYLINSLSATGTDAELLVAAQELQKEYNDKLAGTYDKIYAELIDKGISSVKASFPPLKITEACISLTGMLTGADDRADALETGFAMQGICGEAIATYEDAVISVQKGDESESALNRVVTTFALAKESLANFYEAMIVLADSEEEKGIYAQELEKLEHLQLGHMNKSPFNGGTGSAGGR